MSVALVPQDLIQPRGMSVVTSAVYKVRVAWRTRWSHLRESLALAVALRRAALADAAARVRVALDPSISRTLAAYRVSEAHGFGASRQAFAAPLDACAQSWVQPVELAASFLDTLHRKALAQHWMAQGQAAHTAIAAYTQLAGELMALGAHPELLMHVHAAALERVHHAEGAFSLASVFAGFGISPTAWPALPTLAHASRRRRDEALVHVAERALLEGWLSTSFGAAVAQVAAARATEPAVASHLRMVSEDSVRQAEFGVRLLEWTLKLGGEKVALALALAVRNLPLELVADAPTPGLHADVLERSGVIGPSLRRAIYLSCRAHVVTELGHRLDSNDWRRAA